MRAVWIAALALLFGLGWGLWAGTYESFPYQQFRAAKNVIDGDDGTRVPGEYIDNPLSPLVGKGDVIWQTRADVVMVGDSITAAGRWNEMFPDVDIVNRGIGGDTVDGVIQRLPSILAVEPTKVFLAIGGADALFLNPHDAVMQRFETIADRVAESGAHLYLQSTLECADNGVCSADARQRIRAIDEDLAKLAARKDGVTFIDLNARLSDENGLRDEYTWDGIHLNSEGYRVWREIIQPHIDSKAPRTRQSGQSDQSGRAPQ